MSRISYGLIVICSSTKRTLVIRRRDSPEIIHLLRGFFKRENLQHLISNRTISDDEKLEILLSGTDLATSLRLCHQLVFPKYPIDDFFQIALKRISANIDEIQRLRLLYEPRHETDWLWPKGGTNRDETPIDCAIRETYEETGIKIPIEYVLKDEEPLVADIVTYYNFLCRSYYFIAIVPNEIEACNIPDIDEISKVEWITLEEAERRFRSPYRELVPQVSKYLNT